ncbi:MAG: putative membrane-anchored protein, partial [Akkermansiaceae bacterium]
VERSAQNQEILASMDKRSDLQLRLQHTVEGLSVVAISYYAVSLASYMLYPLAEPFGISKGILTAIAVPVVVVLVWGMLRRLRRKIQ